MLRSIALMLFRDFLTPRPASLFSIKLRIFETFNENSDILHQMLIYVRYTDVFIQLQQL